ncbi:MAG: hypothetical protein OXR84_01320 [Magnetovibrio sp.]|nr:hypothetical protein [Magnetovibrio sp.]
MNDDGPLIDGCEMSSDEGFAIPNTLEIPSPMKRRGAQETLAIAIRLAYDEGLDRAQSGRLRS